MSSSFSKNCIWKIKTINIHAGNKRNFVKESEKNVTFICSGTMIYHLSCVMRKPTMWFLNRSDINRAVQAQKMVRGWKFWI